jgi:hypothetical protein
MGMLLYVMRVTIRADVGSDAMALQRTCTAACVPSRADTCSTLPAPTDDQPMLQQLEQSVRWRRQYTQAVHNV